MKRLEGKVAIVFGAGPDIGGTIAHFLAREGARITINDADRKNTDDTLAFLQSRGYDAIGFTANAIEEEPVAHIVAETVKRHGRLDIVVNLVGKLHWSPLVDMDIRDWTECLLSYPTAAMVTTKHAARAMIAGGWRGSVIHNLSSAAHFGEASATAYGASRAATLSFARSAAMDLAHDGIRVNTITPCGLEHNLWAYMHDEMFDPDYVPPKRRSFYSRDDYLKMIPLERFPRASDIAWAAVYLASDEASFLTGVDIPVDGGLRFKYPSWRPGDFTGVNIKDYMKNLKLTKYGEEHGNVVKKDGLPR
ncbi:MAG: SDR family oxidoreductase [Betaproteobacteria bacterium]|nr:SDR family oxidoreductase [Betaproteobacteria bacterium]